MSEFQDSQRAYESWLKAELGPQRFVAADLKRKHEKMAASPFVFLRATCWRWSEMAGETAADFLDAPAVMSLGDAHVENFGLWQDKESRLVWGVNDFDEAARTPYAFDLIRLMTSALLASDGEKSAEEIATETLSGYRDGLSHPRPFVLEREGLWLRDLFAASDIEQAAFWSKLAAARPASKPPKSFVAALKAALPADVGRVAIFRRQAGMGSLGRARFTAFGELMGGPTAREAKALAPSCWSRRRANAKLPDVAKLAAGPYRAADPYLTITDGLLVRRLAANTRKLERGERPFPIRRRLLRAMGAEIANIHAADRRTDEIRADLSKRTARSLAKAVTRTAAATTREWRAWRTFILG